MRPAVLILLLTVTAASVEASPMTEGDATFASRLYGQLRGGSGNLLFSPASVRLALGMALAGARGETAAQMEHTLALPAGQAAHDGFDALLRGWDALALKEPAQRRIVLRVVNRLWAQSGHPFAAAYLSILRDAYRAPLAQLDFRRAAEAGRVAINKWVGDQTEHKIPELIARGLVTADTRLVLTNAVYFKARWSETFTRSSTAEQPFFVTPQKPTRVPLMRQTQYCRLATFDGGQLLELPYGSGELAMDVLLPSARDGLARLEQQFVDGALAGWLGKLKTVRVDVALPRFRTSSAFALAEALGALGMKKAFVYPDADFSGMDGTHDLFISSVVHQAMVEVDEDGTEAAAATAVMMAAGSAPPSGEPIPFRADHPFLFLIRDTRSGVLLFVGRLVDPAK